MDEKIDIKPLIFVSLLVVAVVFVLVAGRL